MPAEIVFSGGERVEVPDGDAQVLLQRISSVRHGPAAVETSAPPPGWLEVEVKDGVVYVNTSQVAYVRDKRERSKQMHTF